jgi:hypothetical protein
MAPVAALTASPELCQLEDKSARRRRLLRDWTGANERLVRALTDLIEAYEALASALAMDDDATAADAEARVEQLLDEIGIELDEDGRAHVRG